MICINAMQRAKLLNTKYTIHQLQGDNALQKVRKKMTNFIYRSITLSPTGKLWVKFTTNPQTAEKLGGVLTCRSNNSVHPNPYFFTENRAQNCNPNLFQSTSQNIPPGI